MRRASDKRQGVCLLVATSEALPESQPVTVLRYVADLAELRIPAGFTVQELPSHNEQVSTRNPL